MSYSETSNPSDLESKRIDQLIHGEPSIAERFTDGAYDTFYGTIEVVKLVGRALLMPLQVYVIDPMQERSSKR